MNLKADPVRTRGWYHGWTIVAVCILCQAVANGLTYNALSLFLRDWSVQLHAPISSLTLAVAIMGTVGAFISPPAGALADKYSARTLLVLGLLGVALFYIAVGSITATWQLLTLYGVLAAPALILSTTIIANALIARWFVRRRGLALGLSAFGIGLAGVLLPPIIAAILPSFGWRAIWRGGGVLVAVVMVPLVLLTIRDRPTAEEGRYYLGVGEAPSGPHGQPRDASPMSWRKIVTRRNYWLLVGAFLPILALNGACIQNIVPYAASHGLTQRAGANLLALLSLMHVTATLVLGLLCDRFGTRRPLLGLSLVMVAGSMSLAFASELTGITAGCVLVGLGGGVFTLLAAGIAAEFGAEGVGRAFGLCLSFIPVVTLSPYAIAKAQESTGSYAPAFLGFTVLVALSAVLSMMLGERRSTSPPQIGPQASHSDIPL
jgi:MFS family permease